MYPITFWNVGFYGVVFCFCLVYPFFFQVERLEQKFHATYLVNIIYRSEIESETKISKSIDFHQLPSVRVKADKSFTKAGIELFGTYNCYLSVTLQFKNKNKYN